VASAFERALWTQLITAFVGSVVGLAVGFVVAVYGLGAWS
jgi:flagellar biosynthesis protein FliQ